MWNNIDTVIRIVRALLKDRLQSNGRDSFIYQGDKNFTLSEDYVNAASIVVYKNGVVLSTGYSFNPSSNIVTITASLATNDIILITYNFYDKYSDIELTDYIESSFVYFTLHGYRKVFKLNPARDAILTIDGVTPTAKECYQIAIISAINIDPQNIEIRTKDFSLTASEKESKSDLIGKAMTQFTSWIGEITFDEVLNNDI